MKGTKDHINFAVRDEEQELSTAMVADAKLQAHRKEKRLQRHA